jgi:hypothetical protein
MIILFKFMYLHFQGSVLSSVADPDPDPKPDPDPLFRGMDPDRALDPDPCIIIQK